MSIQSALSAPPQSGVTWLIKFIVSLFTGVWTWVRNPLAEDLAAAGIPMLPQGLVRQHMRQTLEVNLPWDVVGRFLNIIHRSFCRWWQGVWLLTCFGICILLFSTIIHHLISVTEYQISVVWLTGMVMTMPGLIWVLVAFLGPIYQRLPIGDENWPAHWVREHIHDIAQLSVFAGTPHHILARAIEAEQKIPDLRFRLVWFHEDPILEAYRPRLLIFSAAVPIGAWHTDTELDRM